MYIINWKQNKKIQQKTELKLKFVYWLITICFIIAFLRFGQLQIIQSHSLANLAETKNITLKTIPIKKGDILTADNQVLATSLPVYSVYGDPSLIDDVKTTSAKLAPIINISESKLVSLLSRNGKFIWLKKYIDINTKQQIKELNLEGIAIIRDFERIYPAQNYLSAIVGFSNSNSKGLEGIELSYDQHLRMSSYYPNNNNWKNSTNSNVIKGGNIKLTINDNYQHIIEQQLKTFITNMQAESGLVIVLNSKTAGILAAAKYPSYNPNIFNLYKDNNLVNPFVGSIYEPGSTFKLITLAIGLENNVVSDQEQLDCQNGNMTIFGHSFKDPFPLSITTLNDVIKKSSNICTIKIGLRLDPSSFYNGINAFNLIKKPNLDMSGAVSGQIQPYEKWKDIDQAILSFGHGIGVSPLQMVAAINVFANNGKFIQPYIIEELQDNNRNPVFKTSQEKIQVISTKTANLIKKYMMSVTQKGGTGYYAGVNGLDIAGKTGTTQIFDRKINKYSQTDHVYSFVGFFPAENPMFTILSIIDNPKKSFKGTKTSTVLFREIAKDIMLLKKPITNNKIYAVNDPK